MIRLLQVGVGPWGVDWAERILAVSSDAVETVGWVDPDQGSLARIRSRLGMPAERCHTDLEKALAVTGADAVLVTAPLSAHAAICRLALEARKHVLVEKPFTLTVHEAQDLVDLADLNDRVLMVNQNYRHFPAPLLAADIVAEARLGTVLSIDVDFRRHAPTEGYRYYAMQHPLLVDMAIHHFDLMRMVLGQEPVEICCRGWNPPGSGFVSEPAAAAIIIFESGAVVTYRGSWISKGAITPYAGEWRMELTEGEISWTSRGEGADRISDDRLLVKRLGEAVKEEALPPVRHVDREGVLRAFAKMIETGRSPPHYSSGRDNIKSLALMGAAVKSAARGGMPIPVRALLGPLDDTPIAMHV